MPYSSRDFCTADASNCDDTSTAISDNLKAVSSPVFTFLNAARVSILLIWKAQMLDSILFCFGAFIQAISS